MDEYRFLTDNEIGILEYNGCTAEDWSSINVAMDFKPTYIKNVSFYGEVNLGVFEKNIEVAECFFKHSGIRNATLRNATIGDNCLIENIGNHINNYVVGEECLICNIGTMETIGKTTFGEGNVISVLNEAGSGNITLFRGLTSNLAAIMAHHSHDRGFTDALRKIVKEDINMRMAETGTIGNRVKIINTAEITNTYISDNCEINGACRVNDCTLWTGPEDSVYIGAGVICENSIITDGSSVTNGSHIDRCQVAENSLITDGFTAKDSMFFANCHMANGEACASFCGPFSTSHHKSTLLIGGKFSFYNAGSSTNFSNHAYKMGPVHYGIFGRGTKTASGSHLLLPSKIGCFSECIGKITNHPDTTILPFSYIIGNGDDTFIVPGRNFLSVGLFRDVNKWPQRDARTRGSRRSIINYEWLNPLTISNAVKGKRMLEQLKEENAEDTAIYTYKGCKIKRHALLRGIDIYDMAVKIFISETIKGHNLEAIDNDKAPCEWHDLSGLLVPVKDEDSIIAGVKEYLINSIASLTELINTYNSRYDNYLAAFTKSLIESYFGIATVTGQMIEEISEIGQRARQAWIGELKHDAEKEYNLGDVEREMLDKTLTRLDEELN